MTKLTLDSSLQNFRSRFAASAKLSEAGSHLIPGGYSRSTFNFGPHAIFVERGDGAYIDTVDGHRLLDLNNNFTVNVLGHHHPAISQALIDAIPSGISFGNPVTDEAKLAQILIDRIPSVEKVKFSCSASESILTAVRIARASTGKTKIAKFEGGYHGFGDAVQISAHASPTEEYGTDKDPKAVADSGGIPRSAVENTVILTQNALADTERILRAHADELACFILELQSGAGGLVVLEPGFVEAIRALTDELGIVLIFDETISLRAGYHGMQGIYGVTPDLTVMGKIIGGGMPLGAVGGRRELMDVLQDGRASISGTHHGHKLALIAGTACMEALDEQAFEKLNGQAAGIMTEVNEWSTRNNSRLSVYGSSSSHLAYGFFNEPGLSIHTHRDYWRYLDGDSTMTMSLELANRGYFPVHRGEFSLSLPMTDDDIDGFVATLQEIALELSS